MCREEQWTSEQNVHCMQCVYCFIALCLRACVWLCWTTISINTHRNRNKNWKRKRAKKTKQNKKKLFSWWYSNNIYRNISNRTQRTFWQMKIEDKVTNFFIQKFITYLIENLCKIYFHLKNFAVMAILIESHSRNIHKYIEFNFNYNCNYIVNCKRCAKLHQSQFTWKFYSANQIIQIGRCELYLFSFHFYGWCFFLFSILVFAHRFLRTCGHRQMEYFPLHICKFLKIIGPGAKSELFTECIWTFWLLFHVLCQYDCDYHFDIDWNWNKFISGSVEKSIQNNICCFWARNVCLCVCQRRTSNFHTGSAYKEQNILC